MTELRKEIRAHEFVRHYYCAEEARLRAVQGIRSMKQSPEIEGGLTVDEWLKSRPHSKADLELQAKLAPWQPFSREFEDIEIIVHPDDFRVEYQKTNGGYVRFVSVEEYKTAKALKKDYKTGTLEYDWFSLRQAEFQVGIYAWVLHPILKRLGYRLSAWQTISVYRRRDGKFLKRYEVKVDFADIEEKISTILKIWRGEIPPIPPQPWKCLRCDPVFQQRCTLINPKASLDDVRPRPELVYLCYPYSDNPKKRTKEILKLAARIVKDRPGLVPIIPHVTFDWYHHYKPTQEPYEDRLVRIAQWEFEMLQRCDFVIVCASESSPGMLWEKAFCKMIGKKVVRLEEVLGK